MNQIAAFSVALCVVSQVVLLHGQSPEQESEPVYAAVDLKPGLPEFEPLAKTLKGDHYSVRIPYDREGHSVYFAWGKDEAANLFCLYLTYPDRRVSTKCGFILEPDENGGLRGVVEFKRDLEQDDMIPIEFRLLPQHHILLYRWVGLKSPASGGMPSISRGAMGVGLPMPDLQFSNLMGETVSTSTFRGRVLVINWWATTCGPCIEEMPGLNELVRKYGLHEDVGFLAVARV